MTGTMNLETLGGGVAGEKFREEVERVLQNILDQSTEWKAKRKVTLEFTFRANRDRNVAEIDIASSVKLAPRIAYTTRANLGATRDGEVVAVEQGNQLTIDEHLAAKTENVVNIKQEMGQ